MKAAILGTGSWGCAYARHLAHKWDDVVMWGIDESAVALINSDAVNPDYLEDIRLPPNVGATLDVGLEFVDGFDGGELDAFKTGLTDNDFKSQTLKRAR